MEPMSGNDIIEYSKRRFAPKAEESCKFCGLWGVKIMDGYNEYFKCSIDHNYRYCQGKCSKYKRKGWFSRVILDRQ